MSLSLDTGLMIVVGLLSLTAVAAVVLLVTMMLGRKAVAHATGLSFIVSVLCILVLFVPGLRGISTLS